MRTVYPRWRGELATQAPVAVGGFGLSPLARGTLIAAVDDVIAARFIPAGAGNSALRVFIVMPLSVYPRRRGELMMYRPSRRAMCGLSPLARGTLNLHKIAAGDRRFIPAGAGNSVSADLFASSVPVYPRWRGELSKHNLLLINDFLSQSQSTNFIVSHKQHIHYVKEHLIH